MEQRFSPNTDLSHLLFLSTKKKDRHHILYPTVADLLASACAVSGLALQDHAELLEEEHKRAALLPGNTQGPSGAAAGSV